MQKNASHPTGKRLKHIASFLCNDLFCCTSLTYSFFTALFWVLAKGMDELIRASTNQKNKCLGEEAWPQAVLEHQIPSYNLSCSTFNNNVHFTVYPVYNNLNLIRHQNCLVCGATPMFCEFNITKTAIYRNYQPLLDIWNILVNVVSQNENNGFTSITTFIIIITFYIQLLELLTETVWKDLLVLLLHHNNFP